MILCYCHSYGVNMFSILAEVRKEVVSNFLYILLNNILESCEILIANKVAIL